MSGTRGVSDSESLLSQIPFTDSEDKSETEIIKSLSVEDDGPCSVFRPAEAQLANRPSPAAVDQPPLPSATSEIRLVPLAPSQKSRGRGRGRPRRQALALVNRQGIPSAEGGIQEASQDQRGHVQDGGSDARFEKAVYTWLGERRGWSSRPRSHMAFARMGFFAPLPDTDAVVAACVAHRNDPGLHTGEIARFLDFTLSHQSRWKAWPC